MVRPSNKNTPDPRDDLARRNRRYLWISAVIVVVMLGVSFAFVPLYRIMCQVLSIPVPRVAVGEVGVAPHDVKPTGRMIEVRFVGEVSKGVPMTFAPMDYKITAEVGRPVLTAYKAFNTSPAGIDGVAVHMLYGMGGRGKDGDIAKFVDLRQCFCFELQHYPGNEVKMLPLNFIITPDIPEGVHTITFAYTLFKALPNDARIRRQVTGVR